MILEQIGNIFSILMNLTGLTLCLFRYFEHPRKTLAFSVIFFLGNMLSNYYWGVYMLVMNDYPNVSSFLAYLGWNLAFMMLVCMQWCLRKEHGIRTFSLLSFIPIPVNLAQLFLYLQFGGIFNNVWQVFWTTASACLSLDTLIGYFRNSKKGAGFPYISAAIFLFITNEFATWTVSCFDWPSEWSNPYNYLSLLNGVFYLLIPLAIAGEYVTEEIIPGDDSRRRLLNIFRPAYTIVVAVCCIGGYFLALWMRGTLSAGIGETGSSDPYSVIAVMLFVVSLIIVSFTITIILVVNSDKESREKVALETARQDAVKSNAAKIEFLVDMSQEIRTPIHAMLGMNEMVLHETTQAERSLPQTREELSQLLSSIRGYSGSITEAGNHLLTIINDILEYSQIEAGRMAIADNAYRLSTVLNDVSNMIISQAKNKGLKYDVIVDGSLPDNLRGDDVCLRKIIGNLLSNAVKYTDHGKIALFVSENKLSGKSHSGEIDLEISVKDTGVGISEEDIATLFDRFERTVSNKDLSADHSGLGLAITKRLLETMGGNISVESRPGRGSTFTATIPQQIISLDPIGDYRVRYEKEPDLRQFRNESFHADHAQILIIDDMAMNHAVIMGLLRKTGIRIETATGGEEAIKHCRNTHYDLILMDQGMPEMDGITVMQHIRKDPESRNIRTPFICLTADTLSGTQENVPSGGFQDYLSKPIDYERLEKMLLKHLPKDKIILIDNASSKTEG
ncbi:MAG: response regulator [Lachnospiraceae bacterium]|nr:response regulator [Lachnospiraceae bacterium]